MFSLSLTLGLHQLLSLLISFTRLARVEHRVTCHAVFVLANYASEDVSIIVDLSRLTRVGHAVSEVRLSTERRGELDAKVSTAR